MSSDLMLDFVNPPMMNNKEAEDISIDQDGEWGEKHFREIISMTARGSARAARVKKKNWIN